MKVIEMIKAFTYLRYKRIKGLCHTGALRAGY